MFLLSFYLWKKHNDKEYKYLSYAIISALVLRAWYFLEKNYLGYSFKSILFGDILLASSLLVLVVLLFRK